MLSSYGQAMLGKSFQKTYHATTQTPELYNDGDVSKKSSVGGESIRWVPGLNQANITLGPDYVFSASKNIGNNNTPLQMSIR